MAENFTPSPVSTFTNDTSAVNVVNNNFTAIATAFTDVLSRGGVSPNQMNSPLDMNNNQIINLPPPSSPSSPARLSDVTGELGSITVPPTGTSGAVVGFLNGNNTYSGTSLFTGAVTINMGSGNTTQGFTYNQNVAGSQSGGLTLPSNINTYGVFQILVPSDSVARPTTGSNKFAIQVMQHGYGGPTMTGGRNTFEVNSYLTATSNSSNNDRNYQATNFEWYSNVNDNGTGTTLVTAAGAGFSIGGAAILAPGATNWLNVTFMEANVAVATGASVAVKTLLQLASLPQDQVHGSVIDAMIWCQNQSGAIGWQNGILFGGNGSVPITTTGQIIAVAGNSTVTNGINLNGWTFTNSSITAPGFAVSGIGQVIVTNGSSPQFAANTQSGQYTGYGFQNVGSNKANIAWDNVNNYLVATIQSSTNGSFVFNNFTGTALVIRPDGTPKFGSATNTGPFTANGAGAAVTFGATTPAAITTPGSVYKWFTVQDNLGNTVYIPCWH